MTRSARAAFVAALLVVCFAVQCALFVRANSQTYDEALTLTSGAILLRGGPDLNAEHPPLARLLAALPMHLRGWTREGAIALPPRVDGFTFARHYLFEHACGHEALLVSARAPMVLVAIALVILVGATAWRRFGPAAGVVAFGLAAFDPNLVAHGSIAGHDGVLAFASALAFFALSELFARPRAGALVALGLALGVALASKFSGIALVIAVMVAMASEALLVGAVPALFFGDDAPPSDRRRAVTAAALNALVAFGIALFVVRAVYAVTGRGMGAWFAGVSAQLAHQAAGHPAYFMGAIVRGGSPAYFPVAIAAKMPLLTLALALAGAFASVRAAVRAPVAARRDELRAAVLPFVVPAALLFTLLLFVRVNIGVRYALPIWPLAIVLAARAASLLPTAEPKRVRVRAVLGVALALHVVSAVRIAPHDLAFFSDAVGAERGARLLSDSNLDWGQDLKTLAAWQREARPARLVVAYFGSASIAAYGIRYQPAPPGSPHPAEPPPPPYEDPSGRGDYLAVSAMTREGVFFGDPGVYAWLDGRTPVARLGRSIEVFDITHDAAAHRELARLYRRFGPVSLAGDEEARAAAVDTGR